MTAINTRVAGLMLGINSWVRISVGATTSALGSLSRQLVPRLPSPPSTRHSPVRLQTCRDRESEARRASRSQREPPDVLMSQSAVDLSAALELSQEISSQLDLNLLLRSATDGARRLMHAQDCTICLLDADCHEQVGPLTYTPPFEQPFPRGLTRRVLGAAQTTHAMDCADCRFLRAHPSTQCVAAPLRLGPLTLGALCIVRDPDLRFSPSEARALLMLAHAAAVAVRNARLLEAGYQQAALAERERLSGELHDHLAPTISFINLKLDGLLQMQSAAGSLETADELSQLKFALDTAYRQLRATLSELHDPQASAQDLAQEVERDLNRFQRETGIGVRLTCDAASAHRLAPLAQLQAAHIVRESLANVRRHAQARSVSVSVERAAGDVRVAIQDDGSGFDTNAVSCGNHLGLDIMRTRVARSGGELFVCSAPGCGTSVVARFPLARTDGDPQ